MSSLKDSCMQEQREEEKQHVRDTVTINKKIVWSSLDEVQNFQAELMGIKD